MKPTDAIETTAEDVESVAALTVQVLGDPTSWKTPAGYPTSLALGLIDSIWSLGVNYDRHVVPVLNRYREHSPQAVTDGPRQLLEVLSHSPHGAFSDLVQNNQRTSTRSGILKGDAVVMAAELMISHSVQTPEHLRNLHGAAAESLHRGWRAIPGQRSTNTGWRYLLLLAGAQQSKPDRMVLKFLRSALGRNVTPDEGHALLAALAERDGLDLRAFDHRIWLHTSGRLSSSAAQDS